jgi:hypothetical protein
MPQQLHKIALAAAKAEDFVHMWIATEPLLNGQRQGVHTPSHIGHPARDPDFYVGWSFHWQAR